MKANKTPAKINIDRSLFFQGNKVDNSIYKIARFFCIVEGCSLGKVVLVEIFFLLSFTLHNIEEGIWLPKWSKNAGKYHVQVSSREFHFALIIVTTFGYIVTFLSMTLGQFQEIVKYVYLGFIFMVCLNSFFPHLIATIALRRYAPGTLTGVLLNLPIGTTIILKSLETGVELRFIIMSGALITFLTLVSLRYFFKIGKGSIHEY
ncbi:MAG: HXXEE domain-containing protein [Veillonellales bacterium]